MEFSCKELLDTIPREQYKTLKFGGVPDVCIGLFGKANTKSFEQLLQTYRIPKGELIAAHLTKKILLATDGVLFTDNAIYVKPENCPEGLSNRIPWSELHQYFFVHKNDTDEVCLYRPDGIQYVLLRTTIIDTTSGNELTDFLSRMQLDILKQQPSLQEKRKKQFGLLKDECERMMQSDALSDKLESALKHLFYEPDFVGEAVAIVATNHARLYPQQAYQQWVHNLPEHILLAASKELDALWEPTATELLQTLKSEELRLSQTYLRSLYTNYMKPEDPTPLEMRIQAALCEKLETWNDVEYIADRLYAQGLDEEADNLFFSRFFDANRKMREIFRQIKEGKSALSQEQLSCTDSMGLTPYHYALILGNQELCSKLMKSIHAPIFGKTDIYDLFSLAVYKGLPYADLGKVIIRTDETAKKLKKAITAIRAEGIASATVETFITVTVQMADGYKPYLDENSKDALSKTYKNVDSSIKDAENELYSYMFKVISETKQRITRRNQSKDPWVRYLHHLYSDPEYFEKMLFHDGEWTLYRTGNGFHYMAPKGEIEAHNPPEEAPRISQKRFGDSWFSESAHENIEVLKKEFRALAKEYHPDASSDSKTTELFQEISAEYEQLQELLTGQK